MLVSGCLSVPPQTARLLANPPKIPQKHIIPNVPFYSQQDYFCGPTTLSEVVNFYGASKTPEQIAPNLFIPELQGSLQVEMVASARQHELLAYAEQGNLEQLFSLVSENIPVIVLQNVATSWYPMWHYALVIGYDLEKQEVVVHSGTTKNRVAELAVFERTWQRGQYWLLAATPANKISQHFKPFVYASAAQDSISVGQTSTGIEALKKATVQWPDYWLSYFLLGNHYLKSERNRSIFWFQSGLKQGAKQANFLNNYAYSLYLSGCKNRAMDVIGKALELKPQDANIRNTRDEILSLKDNQVCGAN